MKTKTDLTQAQRVRFLNRTLERCVRQFLPPEDLTVNEWADKYRRLPPTSAESGQWRTSRTPYLEEPMRAFTDPAVSNIVMVAASQIGKSELELNVIGYIIDQDPSNILYIHPNLEDAKRFSRQRVAPMVDNTTRLRGKVRDARSKRSGDTVLQKFFPGGSLTIVGSNSPSSLASIPCRYIIGDERDRFAPSAGKEGDPWELARKRQLTFYNRKAVEVSTPTIKGKSNIEDSFLRGTQERWCTQCPDCGEFSDIRFDDIKFDPICTKGGRKKQWSLNGPVLWACPKCGATHTEAEMRKQPSKWIAGNPEALKDGVRSFWLNAFASPWVEWSYICIEFLKAKDDPGRLQVVYNTLLGELWEDRGDLEDEDTLMARREDYGIDAEGRPVEVPEGVLVLTCGVDTQDNRLEYEVVGYGQYGETWGIRKGYIMGKPDADATWQQLDDVIDHEYRYKDGKRLTVAFTAVDSGGHFTQDVYEQCRRRYHKRVFAIKGQGGEGVPLIRPPTSVPIRDRKGVTCWLYTIGVDAGKAAIMGALKVQEPGPKYCHFNVAPEAGYDMNYFNGLLSERMELKHTSRGDAWRWVKIQGHNRNEALDCRNYANAGCRILNPDFDAIERRLKGLSAPAAPVQKTRQKTRRNSNVYGGDDW